MYEHDDSGCQWHGLGRGGTIVTGETQCIIIVVVIVVVIVIFGETSSYGGEQ